MLIKDLKDCSEIIAGDGAILKELLHPAKDNFKAGYSLAHAVVRLGETSKSHKLKTSEVYYILSGEGIMHIDDDSAKVVANQAVYIPPHAKQYIENTGKGDLKFLCIVDPAWRAEDEEIM